MDFSWIIRNAGIMMIGTTIGDADRLLLRLRLDLDLDLDLDTDHRRQGTDRLGGKKFLNQHQENGTSAKVRVPFFLV